VSNLKVKRGKTWSWWHAALSSEVQPPIRWLPWCGAKHVDAGCSGPFFILLNLGQYMRLYVRLLVAVREANRELVEFLAKQTNLTKGRSADSAVAISPL
jgi:hypothetical protein